MTKLLQKSLIAGITLTACLSLSLTSQAETTQSNLKQSNPEQSQGQENKTEKFVFDFNNTYDYAACLDVILLAYEQRNAELENAAKNDCATKVLDTYGNNLSKEAAIQLIESANLHATEKLQSPLFPSLGLRRRIAINLGYVYDMDKNNPAILKYIDSEPK